MLSADGKSLTAVRRPEEIVSIWSIFNLQCSALGQIFFADSHNVFICDADFGFVTKFSPLEYFKKVPGLTSGIKQDFRLWGTVCVGDGVVYAGNFEHVLAFVFDSSYTPTM